MSGRSDGTGQGAGAPPPPDLPERALEALASLGDGVIIADARAQLVYANPAAVRLVGIRSLSAPMPSWSGEYGIFLPDERTPFPPAELPLARALRGEAADGVEMFVRNRFAQDGVHLLVTGTPLQDESGAPNGAVVVFHDLTGRRSHLIRQERLAVLGQLAGGVAHQIRNPLAAIMNATYVLKRHVAPDGHPNVEDAIRIIHDEVRHANVIITGLLDYARVRTPDRHPASLIELVERVLDADWIPENVVVKRTLEELPLLDIDTNQLHGALFNLVRNAVEAMPNGGTLHVEVRAEREQAVVVVRDTGVGISPQVSAHLFEPLHSTKPMGVGLGLVTARTFVEAHGGRIAHVEVARGACFEIRLPLR